MNAKSIPLPLDISQISAYNTLHEPLSPARLSVSNWSQSLLSSLSSVPRLVASPGLPPTAPASLLLSTLLIPLSPLSPGTPLLPFTPTSPPSSGPASTPCNKAYDSMASLLCNVAVWPIALVHSWYTQITKLNQTGIYLVSALIILAVLSTRSLALVLPAESPIDIDSPIHINSPNTRETLLGTFKSRAHRHGVHHHGLEKRKDAAVTRISYIVPTSTILVVKTLTSVVVVKNSSDPRVSWSWSLKPTSVSSVSSVSSSRSLRSSSPAVSVSTTMLPATSSHLQVPPASSMSSSSINSPAFSISSSTKPFISSPVQPSRPIELFQPPTPKIMSFNPVYVPPTVQVPVDPSDPFSVPIGTSDVSSKFPRVAHPLSPLDSWTASTAPISTNKFYTNMLLGNRTNPAYVEPFSVWLSKNHFGLGVSSTDDAQIVHGPDPGAANASYFFQPVGILSLALSAQEFATGKAAMNFHAQRALDYSVQTYLEDPSSGGQIWCPLVLGMGYVTGVYYRLTPSVSSAVGFSSMEERPAPQNNMRKYQVTLNNNIKWVVYIHVPVGSSTVPTLTLSDDRTRITASEAIDGTVLQLGRYPDNADQYLDATAGRYQTDAYMTASTNGNQADVRLQYVSQGNSVSGEPLMFVPPHYEGVLSNMEPKRTNFQLRGPSLGNMCGYVSSQLQFRETLPTTIGFLPYHQAQSAVVYQENGSQVSQSSSSGGGLVSSDTDEFAALRSAEKNVSPYISGSAAQLITQTAAAELEQDMGAQTNLDSMYFSGKGLDKFAQIVFVAKYILNNDSLALAGLEKLKNAFAVFANNQQVNPLVYDTTWKGLVSQGGLNDPNADFGNTYYNDHHFHYGYFIHAAAVIALVDRDIGGNSWLAENKDYVNSLVRDTANPTLADPYFPRFRSFDFFAGHSWAKGLFESADGKDEESSSEDYHYAYGMKLWGRVIGDSAMETRANIMLAVMRHSINSYMLFSDDNKIVPPKMVANKVSGICFENKIDYATYFGLNPEYIHGIHMVPVTSASSYFRGPVFVKQEWDQKLSGLAPSLESGWKGILYMNLALIDPKASYDMFSASDFSAGHLDGGMSRTWALAYAAYVGRL